MNIKMLLPVISHVPFCRLITWITSSCGLMTSSQNYYASHHLHNDCKGHTGSILTFGHGATTSSSTTKKIPSKSSCKSELIGLFDKVRDVLWTHQFLEAQGYKIKTNVVYQDNMSTLSLTKNGYVLLPPYR